MQTETAERCFCFIIIHWNIRVILKYFQVFLLIDTVIQSFQCHFGTDAVTLHHLFCLRKESLYLWFHSQLAHFQSFLRLQFEVRIIQMINGGYLLECLICHRSLCIHNAGSKRGNTILFLSRFFGWSAFSMVCLSFPA